MFTQRLRKKETEFLWKKTTLYSVFSALFIGVGCIVAQDLKVQNFYQAIKVNVVKAIGLQNSKTYLPAAFAWEESPIAINNNILQYF